MLEQAWPESLMAHDVSFTAKNENSHTTCLRGELPENHIIWASNYEKLMVFQCSSFFNTGQTVNKCISLCLLPTCCYKSSFFVIGGPCSLENHWFSKCGMWCLNFNLPQCIILLLWNFGHPSVEQIIKLSLIIFSFEHLQNVRFWKVGNMQTVFSRIVLIYWQELSGKSLKMCFSSK